MTDNIMKESLNDNLNLDVINLKKTYGDFSVMLNFSVGMGETLALVGPSGSGKTTALNLISGLAQSEGGQLLSGGRDISSLPSWKRNISVVFQDLALFPHLDVGKNIAYGLFIKKVPLSERNRIVDEMLELVRLTGFAKRRIHTLSGGERQRVAIARALASRPNALLLDEPFSSLDAPLRSSLRKEFLDIRKREAAAAGTLSSRSAPCIFVTHDQEEAVMLGDKIALMSEGRIIECGTGRDLVLSPVHEFTARFFGGGQVLPPGAGGSNKITESGKLFIPNDAVTLEDKSGISGFISYKARFTGAYFKGQSLLMSLMLSGNSGAGDIPFEISVSPRTRLPPEGSEVQFWVDQSLVSNVV